MKFFSYIEQQIKKYTTNKKRPTVVDIHCYLSYGTPQAVTFKGRLLWSKFIRLNPSDGYWRNLVNMYHRFESDEIADAHLLISIGNENFEVRTDTEGFFELHTQLQHALNINAGWASYNVLVQRIGEEILQQPEQGEGQILIVPQMATMGIISDIDDTVIYTGVVSKTKMLYTTLLNNAYTRNVFPGVAQLYWALCYGKQKNNLQTPQNPIFYVSNGPWNLYDLLIDVLYLNKMPFGPIALRDFGWSKKNPAAYQQHKHRSIVKILQTYPQLPFILIGDSGEKDTDLYLHIARLFPKRIIAIYIRNVQDHDRQQRILGLIEQEEHNEVLLFNNSLDMAQHALLNQYITLDNFQKVQAAMPLI